MRLLPSHAPAPVIDPAYLKRRRDAVIAIEPSEPGVDPTPLRLAQRRNAVLSVESDAPREASMAVALNRGRRNAVTALNFGFGALTVRELLEAAPNPSPFSRAGSWSESPELQSRAPPNTPVTKLVLSPSKYAFESWSWSSVFSRVASDIESPKFAFDQPAKFAPTEPAAGTPETSAAQLDLDSFDAFYHSDDELEPLVPSLFALAGIAKHLGTSSQVAEFVRAVRAEYRSNPFHNFRHAFDVTQSTVRIVLQTPMSGGLTEKERTALVLAAFLHDVGHPGVTSRFLVETAAPLAGVYTGAVLEQYHADRARALLESFTFPAQWDLAATVCELILATDMTRHVDTVVRLNALLDGSSDSLPSACDDRLLVLKFVLKLSDISNVAKCKPHALAWAAALYEEFSHQQSLEEHVGVHTGILKAGATVSSMVGGFIGFVFPAFEAFARLAPAIGAEWMRGLKENQALWAWSATTEHLERLKSAAADACSHELRACSASA